MSTETVAQPAPTMIALDTLNIDLELQMREEGIIPDLVSKYVEDMRRGDDFEPIGVITDGVHNWVYSGFHRVAAMRELGKAHIKASVRFGTYEDAEDESMKANATHGQPRSRADLQKAIRKALSTKRWRKQSDRAIGKHLHCDHKTVAAVRAAMEAGGEIPQVEEKLGADGKQYARAARKPTSPPPTTTTEPSSPDYEAVDERLTVYGERLAQTLKGYTDLAVKAATLTAAERRTLREKFLKAQRSFTPLIDALDGASLAKPGKERAS